MGWRNGVSSSGWESRVVTMDERVVYLDRSEATQWLDNPELPAAREGDGREVRGRG